MMHWIVSQGMLDHAAFLEKEGQAVDDGVAVVRESELETAKSGFDFMQRRADYYCRRYDRLVELLREPPASIGELIEAMESRCPEDVIAKAVGCTFLSEIERESDGS
jgi:hypothetical protein